MPNRLTQIWYLALAELHRNYLGTRLGFTWALIQPAATFAIFWLVSVYGLKMAGTSDGPPYFAILFGGLLPWMTLSGAVSSASGSLRAQRHLLMDRVASSLTIVLSNALAAALMHIPLVVMACLIFILAGVHPTETWLFVPYYYICLSALCLATCSLIAPLAARNGDVGQIITTALLLWFWSSPIIWSPTILPGRILGYFSLNPLFYVIEGYRDALLFNGALPDTLLAAMIFWLTVAFIFAGGCLLMIKSEPNLREWLQR